MITAIATPAPDRPDEQAQAAAPLPFRPRPSQPASPLARFTAEIEIHQTDLVTGMRRIEREQVISPGIVPTGDRDFVQGFACGRDLYFDDAYTLVWPDGTEARRFLTSQAPLVRSVKNRDLSSDDLRRFFSEIATSGQSLAYRTGALAGYVATCTADACGLLCDVCGQYRSECQHPSSEDRHEPCA